MNQPDEEHPPPPSLADVREAFGVLWRRSKGPIVGVWLAVAALIVLRRIMTGPSDGEGLIAVLVTVPVFVFGVAFLAPLRALLFGEIDPQASFEDFFQRVRGALAPAIAALLVLLVWAGFVVFFGLALTAGTLLLGDAVGPPSVQRALDGWADWILWSGAILSTGFAAFAALPLLYSLSSQPENVATRILNGVGIPWRHRSLNAVVLAATIALIPGSLLIEYLLHSGFELLGQPFGTWVPFLTVTVLQCVLGVPLLVWAVATYGTIEAYPNDRESE